MGIMEQKMIYDKKLQVQLATGDKKVTHQMRIDVRSISR